MPSGLSQTFHHATLYLILDQLLLEISVMICCQKYYHLQSEGAECLTRNVMMGGSNGQPT